MFPYNIHLERTVSECNRKRSRNKNAATTNIRFRPMGFYQIPLHTIINIFTFYILQLQYNLFMK